MTNWQNAKTRQRYCAGLILGLVVALSLGLITGLTLTAEAKPNERTSGAKKPSQRITRTIVFPKNYSLGNVYVVPYKPEIMAVWTNAATSTQKAQGTVPIRGDGLVMLTGSYQLAENMSVLKTLKPNDLQVLDMYRCEIEDKDSSSIACLSGLIGLQLDDTEIGDSSLKTLSKLSNLVFLSLSSTQITGTTISQLAPLKQLRRLELGRNLIKKENLVQLLQLPQIERLGLQGCRINDEDLDTICKLENLAALLLLDNTQITDLGLKKIASLKKLYYLEISHAQITPNGLKYLTKLPLKRLILGKKQFTPSQIERIKKMFPKAEIAIYDNSSRMDPELFTPLH